VTLICVGACAREAARVPVRRERPVVSVAVVSDVHEPVRAASGCGVARRAAGTFVPRQLEVAGIRRSYSLRLPTDYDPTRAYPVVFRFHGAGGTGLSGGLGIEFVASSDAIIVGPDGLRAKWEDDTDLPFFDALLETVATENCVDRHRVYAYGFSSGGAFANVLGCERGEVVRAVASLAGIPSPGATCDANVAAILVHGTRDDVVSVRDGRLALEQRRVANGCTAEQDAGESGCVPLRGCAEPTSWCELADVGHDPLGAVMPETVWRFFGSLP